MIPWDGARLTTTDAQIFTFEYILYLIKALRMILLKTKRQEKLLLP